jgi:hypothetical protein
MLFCMRITYALFPLGISIIGTAETFAQGTSNMATPSDTNCFSCHVSNTVTISHVFCDPVNGCAAGIQPLF